MSSPQRSSDSSPTFLTRLLDTRLCGIAQRESENDDRLLLYAAGDYWTAFDRSAYQLQLLFPGLSTFVVSHPGYPFAVVGVHIPDRELRRRFLGRRLVPSGRGCLSASVPRIDRAVYARWYMNAVRECLD